MSRTSVRWARVLVAVFLVAGVGGSSPVLAQQGAQEREGKPAKATRAMLADAYLRFERVFFAKPPSGERLREVNRAFDRASLAFFTGSYTEAVRVLDQTRRELEGAEVTAGMVMLDDLVCRVTTRVCISGCMQEIEIRRMSMADGEAFVAEPAGIWIVRRRSGDETKEAERVLGRFSQNSELMHGNSWTVMFSDLPGDDDRACEIVGRLESGVERVLGRYVEVERSMAEARADQERKLREIEGEREGLRRAIAVCRARVELLTDTPSSSESSEFMLDPIQLKNEVEREIEALRGGKDPYRRRTGDYWCDVGLNAAGEGVGIPARVYAPMVAGGETKVPLVIALHGAGGDEHMFMEGYGAGVIRRLADEHGFVVVSPRNGPFSGNGGFFDAVVETMSAWYAIDPARIYVIGHSMGGGVTTSLAKARVDRIAGACCIAGFGGAKKGTRIAPTLVVAAELDALMPIGRARAVGRAAEEAGVGVEYREMTGYGHTLVVGAVLPSAVEWLMTKRQSVREKGGDGRE